MVLAEDLRQAVLQAALQGRLTEQLETDSDVDEMLIRIQEEKKLLFDKKNTRVDKRILIEEDEDKPYDIPKNWRWEKLGNIGIYKKGPFGSALTKSIFVPKSEDTVKVYEQKNAIQKDASLGEYYITKEYFEAKMKGFVVESGDIIVSCAGTIGETYIMPDNIEFGIINQALMRMNIVQSINIAYFLIYFDNVLKTETQKGSKGSAIKNIPPFEVFKKMLIPLPPIEEQQRIIDKISEIMPKIDEYEKIEKELEALKKAFSTDIKDALLQAAMQGKLTEQLESDSSVAELLLLIQKEKKQLIKEKKIYKDKKIVEDVENKFDIDIPNNWRFVNLQEICTQITDGEHKTPNRVPEYQGYYLLSARNILNGKLILDDVDYVSKKEYDKISKRCNPHRNDILISCSGSVGRCCLISDDNNYVMVRSAAMIHCLQMNNKYIMYAIQSPYIQAQIDGLKKQSVQANLFQSAIASLLIPIPPIEEQQRIVERLDALLPLCEDLKEE